MSHVTVSELSQNGVCAVVVTFRPSVDDLLNLAKLRSQVEHLVVVDNGSEHAQMELLREATRELHFTLLENGVNLGIAAALNRGVHWAESRSSAWVALFDQDSTVTENFIACMLDDFRLQAEVRNILLLIPRYRDPKSGLERTCGLHEDGGPFVTITSGSLLPIRAFAKCGYFREELFVYTVDDEFSLRLRSKGYSIGLSAQAVLLHTSGTPSTCRLFGKKLFDTSNYRSGVRYYLNRNRVWMARTYGVRYPRWVRGAFRSSAIDLCKMLIAEDGRWGKFTMVCLGLRDGLLGRMGNTVEL